MESGKPSLTARSAAAHRAAHQLIEAGCVFADPLAVAILGEDPEVITAEAQENPLAATMRHFIVGRARFAEDTLARARARGVRQAVVLGAGLDTLAYRTQTESGLQVFEVDHPATQQWKRERLAAAGIPIPEHVRYVPVDFSRETLAATMTESGFDARQPAFLSWLGVVPYLSRSAIWSTLNWVAGLDGGADIVFDYSDPPELLEERAREIHAIRAARVAGLGEPWITFFSAEELERELRGRGFREIEDLDTPEIVSRYLPMRRAPASRHGGHFVCASTRMNAAPVPV